MNRSLLFLLGILCWGTVLQAQEAQHDELLDAYEKAEAKDWVVAEKLYKEILEKASDSDKAQYNLGNVLYQQERFEDAESYFEAVAKNGARKSVQANAYHNLGNTRLQKGDLKGASQAYKESLRLRPNDMDTKNNLAYVQRQLKAKQQKQQQQNQKDQGEKNAEKQQENQPSESESKNEDPQAQEEKDNKQQTPSKNDQAQDEQTKPETDEAPNEKQRPIDNSKQAPRPTPRNLSREEAERILKITDNEEQKVRRKMMQRPSQKGRPAKEW